MHEYAACDDPYVRGAPRRRLPHRSRASSARAARIRRSMSGIAICCWPRSSATPTMRDRCSTWPRATSMPAISTTRANGMRGAPRWAAGTRRSTSRCSGSPSRWRSSVHRGPTFRTPTCGPGSFGRPAPSRCMLSPCATASMSATALGYLFAERAAQIPFPDEDDIVCRPRHLRLARRRRASGVRILDRQARRGVDAVPAPAGPPRHPRR